MESAPGTSHHGCFYLQSYYDGRVFSRLYPKSFVTINEYVHKYSLRTPLEGMEVF